MRLCVDYKIRTAVTKRQARSTPHIEKFIKSIEEVSVFSTLDLISGYWQVRIYKEDRVEMASALQHALYGFIRMPFGLRNASHTFKRSMDSIASVLKWQIVLVYFDH